MSGLGFPLTRQLSVKIKNKRFEFIIQSYKTKINIIITQRDRIGQMLTAKISKNFMEPNNIDYNIKTILGIESDFSTLLARRLIEDISNNTDKSLLLGCAFDKNIEFEYIKYILKCIDQIKLW